MITWPNREMKTLFICALMVALTSCKHGDSPQPTEKKPASTLDFSHTLIGHWETIDGKNQYYISPGEITFYFSEEDRLGNQKYIILQQYPKSRTIEIRGQVQGSVDFKEINDTKLVFSADYKMAEVYHKSDIAKFLESIGKKVDPSDREPKYMQSSSWRYMDDKQKP